MRPARDAADRGAVSSTIPPNRAFTLLTPTLQRFIETLVVTNIQCVIIFVYYVYEYVMDIVSVVLMNLKINCVGTA